VIYRERSESNKRSIIYN